MTGALIVSGGSRGIGAATAICAAREGWDVAINYARDENAANSVADQVRSLGRRAIIVRGDMCDEEDIQSLFNDTEKELGPLKGLVTSAGTTGKQSG